MMILETKKYGGLIRVPADGILAVCYPRKDFGISRFKGNLLQFTRLCARVKEDH